LKQKEKSFQKLEINASNEEIRRENLRKENRPDRQKARRSWVKQKKHGKIKNLKLILYAY
jgi:hypothetical protein